MVWKITQKNPSELENWKTRKAVSGTFATGKSETKPKCLMQRKIMI